MYTSETEIKEAKIKICKMFLDEYHEWYADLSTLDDREFAKKWDVVPMNKGELKDNTETLLRFLRYHGGFWDFQWEKRGIRKEVLWDLNNEKWLSHDEYSNWNARHTGCTNFYFISQKLAKRIYKAKEVFENV